MVIKLKTDGSEDGEKMHFQGQPVGVPEGLVYEAKTQVGLDESGNASRNFPKIAIDISSLKVYFGCAFSISDTIRAIFWT